MVASGNVNVHMGDILGGGKSGDSVIKTSVW